MTDDQYRRAKELFLRAVDMPAAEREALIQRECADDPVVAGQARRLIAADDGLPPPSSPEHAQERPAAASIPVVPGYRIIAELGEGATAVVYKAEQLRPPENGGPRTVALKIIRAGLLSVERRRRFEHEIRTLASLEHPGIARLYEAVSVAGDSRGGTRPGFAMELVAGDDLLSHARRRCPGDQEKLALFARVAAAVAFAHSRQVVHRDLKPHNILVTESGQPKILDFGVARTAAGELSEATMHTVTGEVLGTVAYMSPEQAAGLSKSVDARSDIYSLGVILFQLLTDRLPYPVEHKPAYAAMRVICDTPPLRLADVRPELAGDAATIVGKALEKDPLRRYQSASELVQDIGRLVDRKPVAARPPSVAYRLWSFVDRRKLLMLGVLTPLAALGVATIGGTTVTLLALGVGLAALVFAGDRSLRIQAERQKLRAATAELERQRWDIFTAANIWFENLDLRALRQIAEDRSRPFDAARAVDEAILRPGLAAMERDYATNSEISTSLRNAAGIAYREIGLFAQAEEQLRKIVLTRESQVPPDHPDLAVAKANVGYLLLRAGRPTDAAGPLLEAVQVLRKATDEVWRSDLAATTTLLGRARLGMGDGPGAVEALQEAVEVRRRMLPGEDHADFGRAMDALVPALLATRDHRRAAETGARAVAILERKLAPDALFLIQARLNLARALLATGRRPEFRAQLAAVEPYAANLPAAGEMGEKLKREFDALQREAAAEDGPS